MNETKSGKMAYVALRKESVDRNKQSRAWKRNKQVALRKESVDRNAWIFVSIDGLE